MKTTFLFGIACATLAFAPVSKKTELKFHLEKDRIYSQTTAIATKSTQELQGQKMEIEQFVSVVTNMERKDEKDSLPQYDMWYDNITMEVSNMGMSQKLTSDTSSLSMVDDASRILSQMVDRKFQANIGTDGRVAEVFGLEEIITEATVSSSGIGAMYSDQFSAGFGDSGLAKNIEMVTDIWPKEEVEVGDSWSNEQYTPTGLPILMKNTYTLTALDKKTGTMTVTSTISTDSENNSTVMSGMEATYYLDGTRNGTIQFETKTGWVTEALMTDSILGNIIISPNEQLPTGMTVPVQFINDINITGE